jgi:hypothetical protein
MEPAHTGLATRAIRYDEWKGSIQMASDVDQLMRVMRVYLVGWSHDQLRRLPADLGAVGLVNSDDLVARAVVASRAELRFEGDPDDHELLREMALTLACAATRLRFLGRPSAGTW